MTYAFVLRAAALATACLLAFTGVVPSGAATGAPIAAPYAMAAVSQPACPAFPAAAFVDRIDNRYLPLIPGATYFYRGSEDGEKQSDVVEVTQETKTILGVSAVVVRDTVRDKRGHLVEQTLDWFAQDTAGNVWYLGEDSKDYENGQVVSTEGSWEAGVDGAQPGIIMEANPHVGDAYSQECAPGVAEDQAEVLDLTADVRTPFGNFGRALLTREFTPLEPGVAENKFYAQCVGFVRSVNVQGGKGAMSLVRIENGPNPDEIGCTSDDPGLPPNHHKRHKPGKQHGHDDREDHGHGRHGKKRHG
jgi:hypothetical protein